MYYKALSNKSRVLSYKKKLITISSFFAYYRLQSASKYFVNTVLDRKGNLALLDKATLYII